MAIEIYSMSTGALSRQKSTGNGDISYSLRVSLKMDYKQRII